MFTPPPICLCAGQFLSEVQFHTKSCVCIGSTVFDVMVMTNTSGWSPIEGHRFHGTSIASASS